MNDRSAKALAAQLKSEGEWGRRRAVKALRDSRAVPPSIQATKGKRGGGRGRHSAFDALAKDGNFQAVALALVKIGSPGFSALMDFLGDTDRLEAMHEAARLAGLGIEGHPDPSSETPSRREVVRALGMIEHPQAVPALIVVLKNQRLNVVVRYRAAQTLIRLRDPQTVTVMIEALKTQGIGWLVCGEVVEVSVQVGLPAVPVLIAALESKDKVLSQKAATALKKIAQRHPDPVLRTALPALRRLRRRGPALQEAWAQIESVTGAFRNLPVPAAAPPLDAQTLPRPADVPLGNLVTPPPGFWTRLRRRLRSS